MNATAELFKALGNETRLSIVQELARRDEEVPGTELLLGCSAALQLAQPTLSQHFSKLVSSGALLERKQGTEKYYTLNCDAFAAAGIDLSAWRNND